MPGGGVALINALSALDDVKMDYDDENTGVAILRTALEAPMRTIAANAGQDGASLSSLSPRAEGTQQHQIGYDVMTGSMST